MPENVFKTCIVCGKKWLSRDEFLADSDISSIGYQANFVSLEKGLFLFNHSCHNTLSIEVHAFADLYDGPIYASRLLGTEDCAGYCLQRNILRPCPEKCECAYVRQVLQCLDGPVE
jgi:hypothetical protein